MRIRSILLLLLVWPSGLHAQERMMRADSAWVRGEHEAAFRIYEELLARDSTTVTALHRMALVMSWNESYDQSLALLDQALGMAPDYTPARIDRARVLGLQGHHDRALGIVEQVLAEDPDNEDGLEVKATVAFWAGRYDVSVEAYERLLARAREPDRFRMPYARVLVALERYPAALGVMEDVLADDPNDVEALRLRAEVLEADGRIEEALEAYERLMDVAPEPSSFQFSRANLLADLGRFEEAMDAVDERLAEQPRNVGFLQAKARWASRAGAFGEAADAYRGLFEATGDLAYRLDQARVLFWDGRTEQALDLVDQVLDVEPSNLDALEAKALYAESAGNYQESLSAYDALIANDPDRTEHLLPRANVLVSDQRFEEAADAFRRVLAETPDDRDALIGLGRVLSWTGQFDSALVVYRGALEVDPDAAAAQQGVAQVTTWKGRLREGESLWRETAAAHPQDVEAWLGLAANLRFQGRYRASEEALDRAAALAESDPARVGELRDLLDRAVAPSLTPSYTFLTDSDENSNHILSVGASLYASDVLQFDATVSHTSLDQSGAVSLEQDVVSADVGVTLRMNSGWALRGGIGLWDPRSGDADSETTGRAGLSSPAWRSVRANVDFVRSVYDATALVTTQDSGPVEVEEFRVGGSAELGARATLFASGSSTQFTGAEENTRLMGSARLNLDVLPWLTTGPAFRAFSYDEDVADRYWDPAFYGLVELPVVLAPSEGDLIPRLEIAPGYQKKKNDHDGEADPWKASFRLSAGLTYTVDPRRQLGISGVFAQAGQQIAPEDTVSDEDYRFGSVSIFVSWAF